VTLQVNRLLPGCDRICLFWQIIRRRVAVQATLVGAGKAAVEGDQGGGTLALLFAGLGDQVLQIFQGQLFAVGFGLSFRVAFWLREVAVGLECLAGGNGDSFRTEVEDAFAPAPEVGGLLAQLSVDLGRNPDHDRVGKLAQGFAGPLQVAEEFFLVAAVFGVEANEE